MTTFESFENIVTLKYSNNEPIISLPNEEAQKLMVDLNIALDRIRCMNGNSQKITKKEKEIIERAHLLKQKRIRYIHI
jgi:hypothetical protein